MRHRCQPAPGERAPVYEDYERRLAVEIVSMLSDRDARPSAAAISSPIWSNSTVSLDRSPGRQAKPVVLVEDNGPIHTSKRSLAALAARAHWLTVEWRQIRPRTQ